jgi:hypothetical protein
VAKKAKVPNRKLRAVEKIPGPDIDWRNLLRRIKTDRDDLEVRADLLQAGDALKDFYDKHAPGPREAWRDDVKAIARVMAEGAADFLRRQGLPASAVLYRAHDSEPWQEEPPATDKRPSVIGLGQYIEQEDFDRDSKEAVAAAIIDAAHGIEHTSGDQQLAHAFALGELRMLCRMKAIESGDNSKSGSHPKRKPWADEQAAVLAESNPHATANEAWAEIPDEYESENNRYAGFEVYRDGNRLKAERNGCIVSITKTTFQKEYWPRAKDQACRRK